MNKTKRKIFEASMKLFAEKGYDATSIEEITATVGVAKGTLYYHFSSKEEIFNFLVEEGVKLLKNSIAIKTSKLNKSIDKIRAIVLIELKILVKYEDFMAIVLSQIWGTGARSQVCKKYVFEYITMIEEIVKELPFDMNNMDLEIAFSEHIDLNKFDNGQEKSSYDWKANEEESKPQTKLLYKVAEIFVKAFSDV